MTVFEMNQRLLLCETSQLVVEVAVERCAVWSVDVEEPLYGPIPSNKAHKAGMMDDPVTSLPYSYCIMTCGQ
jgi:hypothetical protein